MEHIKYNKDFGVVISEGEDGLELALYVNEKNEEERKLFPNGKKYYYVRDSWGKISLKQKDGDKVARLVYSYVLKMGVELGRLEGFIRLVHNRFC